jgi:hypothetical protein
VSQRRPCPNRWRFRLWPAASPPRNRHHACLAPKVFPAQELETLLPTPSALPLLPRLAALARRKVLAVVASRMVAVAVVVAAVVTAVVEVAVVVAVVLLHQPLGCGPSHPWCCRPAWCAMYVGSLRYSPTGC